MFLIFNQKKWCSEQEQQKVKIVIRKEGVKHPKRLVLNILKFLLNP